MFAAVRHQATEDVCYQSTAAGGHGASLWSRLCHGPSLGPMDVLGEWGTVSLKVPRLHCVDSPRLRGSADQTSLLVIQMPVCIHRAVLCQVTQRSRLPSSCNPWSVYLASRVLSHGKKAEHLSRMSLRAIIGNVNTIFIHIPPSSRIPPNCKAGWKLQFSHVPTKKETELNWVILWHSLCHRTAFAHPKACPTSVVFITKGQQEKCEILNSRNHCPLWDNTVAGRSVQGLRNQGPAVVLYF